MNTLQLLLVAALLALFALQLTFYLIFYWRPYRKRNRSTIYTTLQPPISVIVYAKEQARDLDNLLPTLFTQNYPTYEAIIIDDDPSGDCDDIIKRFSNNYPNLRHTFIPQNAKYLNRRKLALTLGVKAAQYDLLLFTDADCRPLSPQWLATLARNYDQTTLLVLGFCAYPHAHNFLQHLIAYDNLLYGLRFLAAALANNPCGGDHKNLSCRKNLFLQSPDYALSLQQAASQRNNALPEYHPDSIAMAAPIFSLAQWNERREIRSHYAFARPPLHKTEQTSLTLFLLTTLAALTTGIIQSNLLLSAAATLLYILLCIIKSLILNKSAALLQQPSFAARLPLLELTLLILDIRRALARLLHPTKAHKLTSPSASTNDQPLHH